jgi:hypothetical protein
MKAPGMSNELVPMPAPTPDSGQKSLELAVGAAAGFIAASKAAATRRAYASDWRDFTAWCVDHGQTNLPAVAAYLSALASAGAKISTVRRRRRWRSTDHPSRGNQRRSKRDAVPSMLNSVQRVPFGILPWLYGLLRCVEPST